MKKNKFYLSLGLFTIVLAVILFIVQNFQLKIEIGNLSWAALIYFSVLTLVIYKISYSALDKNNKTFLWRIYSAIGLRLIFSVFPMIIYVFFVREHQISFIIVYLLMYFFYTAFEIYCLVITLRPIQKK